MIAMVLSRAAWQAELVELVRRHYPEVSADVVRRIALLASEGGLLSPEQPPSPPTVRVEATFPASDGSQPERLAVVWEAGPPAADVLAAVVAALGRVQAGARAAGHEWAEGAFRFEETRLPAVPTLAEVRQAGAPFVQPDGSYYVERDGQVVHVGPDGAAVVAS